MPMITLVAEEIAEIGKTFVYTGEDPLCENCRIRSICFNLEKGARYRVKALRPTFHDCEAAEGRVRVVEVERVNREAAVATKGAMEGSTVTFTRPDCPHVGCPQYALCHPEGIDDGDKVTIVTMGKKVECALGESRAPVVIR